MTSSARTRVTLSWGVLDQIVSSVANFAFVVIAAKALASEGLGAIAFTFELYLLGLCLARGLSGDPLMSRVAHLRGDALRTAIGASTSACLLAGTGLGALVATASLFASAPLAGVLLVAGLAMPGLVLQDYVRSAFVVQNRVRMTCLNDTFWAVAQVPALVLAIEINPTATTVFGAWAATGCLAGVIGLVQLKCGLSGLRGVRDWLRETRSLWPYYLADNMAFQLTSVVFVMVLSGTAGLAAMAGFRVAMTVYSPLSTVARGVASVGVAALARRSHDPRWIERSALLISWVMTPFAFAWGLVLLLVPTHWGTAAFGESWLEAEPLVFLASFVTAAGLFGAGSVVGLRALGAGRSSLAGRLAVSLGATAAAATGGALAGLHGAFVALAITFPYQVAVWWWLLRRSTQAAERATTQAIAST